MPAIASAHLQILLEASVQPATPRAGALTASLTNGTTGERWTDGQASGMIDKISRVEGTLAAAATDSYNVLAAGSMNDILAAAIDLDELKALAILCNTGSIKFIAPAANYLGLFVATTDGFNLAAGQMAAFSFGAAGLAIGANGKFDITDTAGGAGSTYSLMFIGSN